MTKRGHRRGSVYRIKSGPKKGKWVARLLVDTLDGEKRRYRYRNSYAEALEALEDLKREAREGIDFEATGMTLREFLDRWLRDAVKDTVKQKTYDGYAYNVRSVPEALGKRKLQDVNAAHIQTLYRTKLQAGLSHRTVRYLHTTLNKAMKQAVKWRLILHNPIEGATPPRKINTPMEAFDKSQVDRILKAIRGDRLEALYTTAIFCGLRAGELFGLRHEDLELDSADPVLQIRQQLVSTSAGEHFDEPKGKRSRRVHVPKIAALSLLAHLQHQQREKDAMTTREWVHPELVFTGPRGGLIKHKKFLVNEYYPTLQRAEVPRKTFHALRHTYATLMIPTGVHPKIVSEAMGHASVSITLDLYSHVMPSMQSEAAAKLNGLFADSEEGNNGRD